jgi:hypothetical protein
MGFQKSSCLKAATMALMEPNFRCYVWVRKAIAIGQAKRFVSESLLYPLEEIAVLSFQTGFDEGTVQSSEPEFNT